MELTLGQIAGFIAAVAFAVLVWRLVENGTSLADDE